MKKWNIHWKVQNSSICKLIKQKNSPGIDLWSLGKSLDDLPNTLEDVADDDDVDFFLCP